MRAIIGFDYESVGDAAVAGGLREGALRIRERLSASVIEVGADLLKVKAQLGHGQFVAWVEAECGIKCEACDLAATQLVDFLFAQIDDLVRLENLPSCASTGKSWRLATTGRAASILRGSRK